MAFQEAAKQAKPILLEPVMRVEVTVPEQFMGDVTGLLSSKRGQIQGMEPRGLVQVIRARVPLAELFGFTTELRSLTEGRGNWAMEFDRFEPVPPNVAAQIAKRAEGVA
jgi:elongation factor G